MADSASLNELRKARRRAVNERNTLKSKGKDESSAKKRNKEKDTLVDLSSKDAHSPKGLYV